MSCKMHEHVKRRCVRGSVGSKQSFYEQEVLTKINCWVARVSSYSNIADAPSRGDTSMLRSLGFEDVSILAYAALEQLFEAMVNKMGNTADYDAESQS